MSIRNLKIDAVECTCERCGAVWMPKPIREGKTWATPLPIACTSCKSPYWNKKPA
jgi:hypothetical protein